TPTEAILLIVYATLVGFVVLVIANGSALHQYEKMRKSQIAWYRSLTRRKPTSRGGYASGRYLPTHHKSSTVDGQYNADLERYGRWYGIDPDDEDAKRSFLSDLDQDEQEDRRG